MGSVPDENPQQLIDLHSPSEIVKQTTSISTEPQVEVEITTADA
jgi:ribosomal protein S10